MSWPTTLPRQQRHVLAAALAIVACLVGLVLVYGAISYFVGLHNERLTTAKQLSKVSRLVASAPAVRAAIDEVQARPEWTQLLPQGESNPQLQQRLRALAQAQGIALRNVQPLPNATSERFQAIRLRIAFSADYKALGQWLVALRQDPIRYDIEVISVSVPTAQPEKGNPLLTVTADIASYQRVSEVSP